MAGGSWSIASLRAALGTDMRATKPPPNPHPGEILMEEFLKPMDLSQTALACAIEMKITVAVKCMKSIRLRCCVADPRPSFRHAKRSSPGRSDSAKSRFLAQQKRERKMSGLSTARPSDRARRRHPRNRARRWFRPRNAAASETRRAFRPSRLLQSQSFVLIWAGNVLKWFTLPTSTPIFVQFGPSMQPNRGRFALLAAAGVRR
jgi:hypothetical protein